MFNVSNITEESVALKQSPSTSRSWPKQLEKVLYCKIDREQRLRLDVCMRLTLENAANWRPAINGVIKPHTLSSLSRQLVNHSREIHSSALNAPLI